MEFSVAVILFFLLWIWAELWGLGEVSADIYYQKQYY